MENLTNQLFNPKVQLRFNEIIYAHTQPPPPKKKKKKKKIKNNTTLRFQE